MAEDIEKRRARSRRSAVKRRLEDPDKIRAYNRAYYKRNAARILAVIKVYRASETVKEKARAWVRKYALKHAADPEKWLKRALSRSRSRARKGGMEHTIIASDIVLTPACPVFGVTFVFCGKLCDTTPTFDRFNNALGYVPGNVRIISHRANSLKRDATVADMRAVLAYMEGG